ncbi:ArsR family transcriptional regulator [Marivivens niveibacter]|uniref:ArsR family transcriptional regulator n=1 Tax=Marivivens niveibacter TaxID=1930667 RepID=A0A251WW74_9RHOB|nr:helix-turn-helix domain-containing protein [Marivivens niveibacter]OUD08378.1 ArsR family transcriptional regulator [Marivivens niveibacter]
MEKDYPSQLTTLGHPQRLAIFRLLMRRYPDHVPAGEIASALGIKASTASTYLSALMRTGLVIQQRAGTSLLYAVDMTTARHLFDYLFSDCCRGRADICLPFLEENALPKQRKFNVLFVCTGNSARSIFAESILRNTQADRFNVYSAGTQPKSQINPIALKVLRDKGHDIISLKPNHISDLTEDKALKFDFIFTVCDHAANEECRAWNGNPITGHWGLPDPVKDAEGDAFYQTYDAIKHRIEHFTAIDLENLGRVAIQRSIDDIGRISQEART